MASREALLSQTFVELADTLLADFDVIDLLTVLTTRCVELLEADAAGVLLADPTGVLRVLAASHEQAHLLDLFQVQNQEGPCLDASRSGVAALSSDLTAEERWPRFAPASVAAGYAGVGAFPLRLRQRTIGALNLFFRTGGPMTADNQALAQALADAATIAILNHEASREASVLTGQLQSALTSRVAIEQAKGMLAERCGLSMDEAFGQLRRYARGNNLRLGEIARAFVAGNLDPAAEAAIVEGRLR